MQGLGIRAPQKEKKWEEVAFQTPQHYEAVLFQAPSRCEMQRDGLLSAWLRDIEEKREPEERTLIPFAGYSIAPTTASV